MKRSLIRLSGNGKFITSAADFLTNKFGGETKLSKVSPVEIAMANLLFLYHGSKPTADARNEK